MKDNLGMKTAGLLFGVLLACTACLGQDLTPRAYVITPIHFNAVILTNSFFSGNLNFNGAVPITDATAKVNVPIFSLNHSFKLFGRSGNIVAALPYGVGNFQGTAFGTETTVYRSGLFDSSFRVSVNLKGGPAMDVREFMKYRQKTVLGVSLRVSAPTGQYDPQKLINYGANRWAFKPEVGYSRRMGHWILDGYGGVWFYTRNPEFFSRNAYFPGTRSQTQEPIGALEGHLSYDVRSRFWVSLDGNFWYGGRTSWNGVENPETLQENSRLGVTASFPFTRHGSLKVSYSRGAYVRFGGDFQNLSVGWQYSWLGRPN
jgi:hypothetical protein